VNHMAEHIDRTTDKRLQVMMIAEGTYPYAWGGVSTWCHLLLSDMPDVDFTLMSIVGDPSAKAVFPLPESVVDFRTIPMWGTRDLLENKPDITLAEIRARKQRTSEAVVTANFVPLFRAFLEELFADEGHPERLARIVYSMHRFFLTHDFDQAMQSRAAWRCFVQVAQACFPKVATQYGQRHSRFYLGDLTTAMRWLYHWFFPIGAPIPKVDIAHAAMAGVCTLVAVAAKFEHGAAFMLTEHGIYLRERYLAESTSARSFFLKVFSLRFALRMTELSYAMADHIAPCCDFNQRWELRHGAKPEQIQTIYYGVDSGVFTPAGKPFGEPPIVVWVGRIDPLKDVLTLLRAAAVVHKERPDIEFRLFGSAPVGNEAYMEKCLELRKELGLESTVVFAGFRSNPATAYNEGDVVILSSVSEAFPFVILEAMLCEKPIVATAVGGVPEQVEGCGFAVEPRNPEAMGEAILKLMNDPELSIALGRAARIKACEEYSVRQSAMAHGNTYIRLARNSRAARAAVAAVRTEVPARQRMGHGIQWVMPRPGLAPLASAKYDASGPQLSYAKTKITIQAQSVAAAASSGSNYAFGARGSNRANGAFIESSPAATPSQPDGRAHKALPVVSAGDPGKVNKAQIAALAADVAARSNQLLDVYETTALVESIGVTDEVAAKRYGVPDTFALGEAVLSELRKRKAPPTQRERPVLATTGHRERWIDYAKGVSGLVPPLVILLIIALYSYGSHASERQVWFLSAGMTASLFLTNGVIQGISRRTSLYLGLRKPGMAARFLTMSTGLAMAVIAGIGLAAIFAVSLLETLPITDVLTFVAAFLGLALIWILAGWLSLLGQPYWLALALCTGTVIGVVTSIALAPVLSIHLFVATVLGYTTALSIISLAIVRRFTKLSAIHPAAKTIGKFPARAYLVAEGFPYFAYGTLYMLFILLPHVAGWVGTLPADVTRSAATSLIEIGLTLAMPPLILAYGLAEYALRMFWLEAPFSLAATPATDITRFGDLMVRFCSRHRKTYMLVLALLSIGAHCVFWVALEAGWLQTWAPHLDNAQVLFVFDFSLLAYWFVGIGTFNCMFAMTLGRPQAATRGVVWATLTLIIVGAALCTVNFIYAPIAFACAGFVFAIVSMGVAKETLRTSDYYFASIV
jgi:polysaccharide biosynthesis protein PelF